MTERSRGRAWYKPRWGLRVRIAAVHGALRWLPGSPGLKARASWITQLRHKQKRRTISAFNRVVTTLDEGSIVLDCGANRGEVTARLAATGAQVHSFEPEPHLFALLQARFSGHRNVTLHHAAISARQGTAELRVQREAERDPSMFDGHSIIGGWGASRQDLTVTVPCIDFVEFLRGLGRKPSLVKMDIEGAEVDILERMVAEDLLDAVGPMFVELHERQIPFLRARTATVFRQIEASGKGEINLLWP